MHLLLSELTQIPPLAIAPDAESTTAILPGGETARLTATLSGAKADDALLTFDQVLAQKTPDTPPPQADTAPDPKGEDGEADVQKPIADETEGAEHSTKKPDPADPKKTTIQRAEPAPELAQVALKRADVRDHPHQKSVALPSVTGPPANPPKHTPAPQAENSISPRVNQPQVNSPKATPPQAMPLKESPHTVAKTPSVPASQKPEAVPGQIRSAPETARPVHSIPARSAAVDVPPPARPESGIAVQIKAPPAAGTPSTTQSAQPTETSSPATGLTPAKASATPEPAKAPALPQATSTTDSKMEIVTPTASTAQPRARPVLSQEMHTHQPAPATRQDHGAQSKVDIAQRPPSTPTPSAAMSKPPETRVASRADPLPAQLRQKAAPETAQKPIPPKFFEPETPTTNLGSKNLIKRPASDLHILHDSPQIIRQSPSQRTGHPSNAQPENPLPLTREPKQIPSSALTTEQNQRPTPPSASPHEIKAMPPTAAPPVAERPIPAPRSAHRTDDQPRADAPTKTDTPLPAIRRTLFATPQAPTLPAPTQHMPLYAFDKERALSSNAPADLTGQARAEALAPSAPTPQVTPPRTEAPMAALRQIIDVAQHLPSKPVEITLSPEELGRVRLSVSSTETGILLNVHAERPDTLDLLRRHISTLGQQLQGLGYEDVAFTFAGGGPQAGQQDQPVTDDDPHPADSAPSIAGPNSPTALAGGENTGLDIRL